MTQQNLTKSPRPAQSLNPDTSAFLEWLKTIPVGDYKSTVERIKEECEMNKDRFYNITGKKARLTPLEKRMINAIAQCDIFNKTQTT